MKKLIFEQIQNDNKQYLEVFIEGFNGPLGCIIKMKNYSGTLISSPFLSGSTLFVKKKSFDECPDIFTKLYEDTINIILNAKGFSWKTSKDYMGYETGEFFIKGINHSIANYSKYLPEENPFEQSQELLTSPLQNLPFEFFNYFVFNENPQRFHHDIKEGKKETWNLLEKFKKEIV